MHHGQVYVELNGSLPSRILKNRRMAIIAEIHGAKISVWPRKDAVESIRSQVFEVYHHECRDCGKSVTWEGCQMHEVVPRSKGGLISIENSVILCYDCHQGRKNSAHGSRRPKFSKQRTLKF